MLVLWLGAGLVAQQVQAAQEDNQGGPSDWRAARRRKREKKDLEALERFAREFLESL